MLTKEFKTREEYFAYDALNYSYLKSYDKDPEASRESNLSGTGVTFGSAVDCLLFDGKEEFDNQYMYILENKPTASALTLFESIVNDVKNGKNPDEVNEDYMVAKVGELGLWTTCKSRDAIVKKFTPEFLFYTIKTIKNINKVVLDEETYSKVLVAESSIRNEPYSSKLFDDYETKYQLAFAFKLEQFKGLEFKAMLDMICIDHKNKKVIPVDLKTMSDPAGMFKSNFIHFQYYIQAQLYIQGLRVWMDENGMKEYTIEPFHYIVVSSLKPNRPYVYKIDNVESFINKLNESSVYHYKSLNEIVNNYIKNQSYGFEYPVELIENSCIDLM